MRDYDLRWHEQSRHSGESMPLGGHSVGCNVWVENGELLLYFQQSGGFDENGSMLKGGRLRIAFDPNPFTVDFLQQLLLEEGYILVEGRNNRGSARTTLWVDARLPVIHIDISAEYGFTLRAQYETWRDKDRRVDNQSYELFQCKEVWGDPDKPVIFRRDQIEVTGPDALLFYHRNRDDDLSFDREMDTQGLRGHKADLYNPQKGLTTGGLFRAAGMRFCGTGRGQYIDTEHLAYAFESVAASTQKSIEVYLLAEQSATLEAWRADLATLVANSDASGRAAFDHSRAWWREYWARSFIRTGSDDAGADDPLWKIGRNYQLFRYLLGCNYAGEWPTKFNGGLFTFDPILAGTSPWSDIELRYTPDYRLWGGGSHTAQNQRLLYWPMLKSGDFAPMRQLFDFYCRTLGTAQTRARVFFGVDGAVYPEQVGIYGLCPTCDHGWGNETGLPVPQIRYHFSTALEVSLMILEYAAYTGEDISQYVELMDGIVKFYDGFYPRDDSAGKMVIDPGNALETHHPVRNPVDAVAGLDAVLRRLLQLPAHSATPEQRRNWLRILGRVPPLSFREKDGRKIIAYAETSSPLRNCEVPELYTVFPFGQFGLGKPDLQVAIDTARLAPESDEQLTHISWHQQGIQYARLGMVPEAMDFLQRKLGDAEQRTPVFWGPGHDWTPDHNWGGSGMIQLQDMLLQAEGEKISLFPCWDRAIDVWFRLWAPRNTVVECRLKGGVVERLTVTPAERLRNVEILLEE
ncbi:MAG: DUF5703 domain-containing protein [Anaerolineae bacterium]|nr:DUF5703 domain-containing protein [Anaerolineae bacterium]